MLSEAGLGGIIVRGIILILAVIGAVVGADSAFAADMPVKATPRAVIAESWTGFYVGGYIGGAFGTSDWFDTDPGFVGQPDARLKPSGFIGGGQVGYNYQINQFVLGIEGEGAWTNYMASATNPPAGACFTSPPQSCKTEAHSLAMLTGRAGMIWGQSLVYAKGGVAWGRFSYENLCPACGPGINWFAHETRTGWTIGGGLEYMFNHSWSAKFEYNYVDFGTGHPLFVSTPPGFDFNEPIRNHVHIAKVGVNYHFNSGELIPARY